jgi:hypothetical protein
VEAKRKPIAKYPARRSPFLNGIYVAMALLAIALVVFNAVRSVQAGELPKDTVLLSQAALGEKYGLQVNLLAVTAAGGMVDLRLKIVDAAKAETLLGDAKNLPTLFVNHTRLFPTQEISPEAIKFENGTVLVVLFSNPRNLITPGTPVTVMFGNTAVEPIESR